MTSQKLEVGSFGTKMASWNQRAFYGTESLSNDIPKKLRENPLTPRKGSPNGQRKDLGEYRISTHWNYWYKG